MNPLLYLAELPRNVRTPYTWLCKYATIYFDGKVQKLACNPYTARLMFVSSTATSERNKMKAYVGAGSSNTPSDVLSLMSQVARVLSSKGITLRCSEQSVADRAFIQGAQGRFFSYVPQHPIDDSLDQANAVYTPYSPWAIASETDPSSGSATFARSLDPKFLMLPEAEKRWEVVANSLIYSLDRESVAKMLICWSQPGDHVERYLKKAVKAGVPVYNLAQAEHRETIQRWIK